MRLIGNTKLRFRRYVQSAVRRPADELAELVDLKERGVLRWSLNG